MPERTSNPGSPDAPLSAGSKPLHVEVRGKGEWWNTAVFVNGQAVSGIQSVHYSVDVDDYPTLTLVARDLTVDFDTATHVVVVTDVDTYDQMEEQADA